jgi:hypothetical protein
MMEVVNVLLLAAQLAFGTGTNNASATTQTNNSGVVITVDTVGLQ